MKKTIINVETQEVTVRDLTAEEIAELEAESLASRQARQEQEANIESAKAKLTALGLDEAEVQAILGL